MKAPSSKRDPTMGEVAAIALRSAGEDSVLVGGMAVSLLAGYFGVKSEQPVFTRDADFVGGLFAIEQAEENLRGLPLRRYLATMDEAVATPNFGKIAVDLASDAAPVEIDFLPRLDGLSIDEIEQKAMTIEVDGKTLRVIHPLLALENKIINLALYPATRDEAGVGQARLMVRVVRKYLAGELAGNDELAGNEDHWQQLPAIERIGRFAMREPACFAHQAFAIDVLAAVPKGIAVEAFQSTRWPQIRKLVAYRRRRFAAAWERSAKQSDPMKSGYRA